jgi:hypothetical protein
MAYVKAVIGAVVAALLLGAAAGGLMSLKQALASISPQDRATILASTIAETMNCAAFFVLVFVPLALVLVFVRRWRRRRAPGRVG